MDTDDLSRDCYDGVLMEAAKLAHDLTLHYGLLSGDCKNETDYLDKAEKMTREIMQADDWELDNLFCGNPPDNEKFSFTCRKILENVERVKSIPIEKRKFDY